MILELIATFCAALFAGAAVYINLVEHPARMSLGNGPALAEWAPSYHRATLMQAPLALVGALAAGGAWLAGGGAGWLAGGVLLGLVIPITLIVIFPTNRQLLDPATAGNLERVGLLLRRWNRLHALRSVLSTAALLIFLALLG
ncbi:MAG TPA: DUF1772 domain-containing protein [Longimicrobium sp.]|jgi:hypothetical protein|uniref:DUF1772 domain-containing protein n=1 Tax=Longimicrobium sp. TaxID=2029185 RepID=UPI002EDA9744